MTMAWNHLHSSLTRGVSSPETREYETETQARTDHPDLERSGDQVREGIVTYIEEKRNSQRRLWNSCQAGYPEAMRFFFLVGRSVFLWIPRRDMRHILTRSSIWTWIPWWTGSLLWMMDVWSVCFLVLFRLWLSVAVGLGRKESNKASTEKEVDNWLSGQETSKPRKKRVA